MMARLIDADELKKWLKSPVGFRANCEDCTSIDCLDCIIEEAIDNAPTIEAAPVVHGRWDDECRCTVCGWYGEDWYKRDAYHFDYCPNCGAKMDGGVCDG